MASKRNASPTSNEDKANRVFSALADGQRLTLKELIRQTRLSPAQTRVGWAELKRYLGTMCVVEYHRQDTVYFLSNGDDATPGIAFILWQAKHLFTRIITERRSVLQLTERTAAMGHTEMAPTLAAAEGGLRDAQGALKALIRANWMQLHPEDPAGAEAFLARDVDMVRLLP